MHSPNISQRYTPPKVYHSPGTRCAWSIAAMLLAFALMLLFICTFNTFAATVIPTDEIHGPTVVVCDSSSGISLPMAPEISQYNILVTDGFAHIRLTQLCNADGYR